jgi:hypothetical protein
MAARLRLRHQDEVREKIRASQLVNRLESHVLGEVDMTSTQVTAALGLLRKCVPDLSDNRTELETGESLTTLLLTLGKSQPPAADNP